MNSPQTPNYRLVVALLLTIAAACQQTNAYKVFHPKDKSLSKVYFENFDGNGEEQPKSSSTTELPSAGAYGNRLTDFDDDDFLTSPSSLVENLQSSDSINYFTQEPSTKRGHRYRTKTVYLPSLSEASSSVSSRTSGRSKEPRGHVTSYKILGTGPGQTSEITDFGFGTSGSELGHSEPPAYDEEDHSHLQSGRGRSRSLSPKFKPSTSEPASTSYFTNYNTYGSLGNEGQGGESSPNSELQFQDLASPSKSYQSKFETNVESPPSSALSSSSPSGFNKIPPISSFFQSSPPSPKTSDRPESLSFLSNLAPQSGRYPRPVEGMREPNFGRNHQHSHGHSHGHDHEHEHDQDANEDAMFEKSPLVEMMFRDHDHDAPSNGDGRGHAHSSHGSGSYGTEGHNSGGHGGKSPNGHNRQPAKNADTFMTLSFEPVKSKELHSSVSITGVGQSHNSRHPYGGGIGSTDETAPEDSSQYAGSYRGFNQATDDEQESSSSQFRNQPQHGGPGYFEVSGSGNSQIKFDDKVTDESHGDKHNSNQAPPSRDDHWKHSVSRYAKEFGFEMPEHNLRGASGPPSSPPVAAFGSPITQHSGRGHPLTYSGSQDYFNFVPQPSSSTYSAEGFRTMVLSTPETRYFTESSSMASELSPTKVPLTLTSSQPELSLTATNEQQQKDNEIEEILRRYTQQILSKPVSNVNK